MSKTITISDNAYNIIKQSAGLSGRSLIKELDVLLSGSGDTLRSAGGPKVAQPDGAAESQPKVETKETKDTKNKPVSEMTNAELREEFDPLDRVLDNGGKLYNRADRYKELGEEIEARGGYVEWPDVIE